MIYLKIYRIIFNRRHVLGHDTCKLQAASKRTPRLCIIVQHNEHNLEPKWVLMI
jgi:hypothetical protein